MLEYREDEDYYDDYGAAQTPVEDEEWGPTTGWRWNQGVDQSNRSAPLGMKWKWMGYDPSGSRRINNDYGWQLVSNVAPTTPTTPTNTNTTTNPPTGGPPPNDADRMNRDKRPTDPAGEGMEWRFDPANGWYRAMTSFPSGSGSGSGSGGGTDYPGWQASAYGGGPYDFPMLSLPDMPALPTLERYDDYTPAEWKAPNPSDIYGDPSYQFRFAEGMRPIESSRAAQGLTRTGATLKALSRYGQNFASNEYDRIYNRAADSYDRTNSAKYQAWVGNRQNRLDAYDRSRSNVLDTYDRSVSKARDEFAPRQKWAELQYNRDWDVYKYQNDDEYRKWAKKGDWNNQIATSYPRD